MGWLDRLLPNIDIERHDDNAPLADADERGSALVD